MGSTSPLTFRKATPADIPALLALVRSAYRGESSRQGWTTEADFITDDRIDAAGLLAKITAPGSAILLVTSSSSAAAAGGLEDTVLLACCEVLRYPAPSDLSYFGLFAVSPRLQNGGIGKIVLAEAERYAREEMDASRMEMQVVWLREELIAWYIRWGYVIIERETRPFPYEKLVSGEALRDDLNFLVLRKDLV